MAAVILFEEWGWEPLLARTGRYGKTCVTATKSRSWQAAFWRVDISFAILEGPVREKILTHSGAAGAGAAVCCGATAGSPSDLSISGPHVNHPGSAAHVHLQDLLVRRGIRVGDLVFMTPIHHE